MGTCLPNRNDQIPKPQITPSHLSPEEKIISQSESKHIFSKKPFKDLSKSIKSESSNGFLSSPQLKRALLDLEISLDDLTSPNSSTYHLLSRSKNERNLYEVRKLTLICIYLGIGSPGDKCEWLFRQYDSDASLDLDNSEFQVMLEEIFDVCARILPVLSVGEGVNSLTNEQCSDYSQILLSGRQKAAEQVIQAFSGEGQVDHEKFISLMTQNSEMKQLMSSTCVRELLRKKALE
jgi:Ca2+-binding EF-hand superfamily protein